jgi:hypothetical protein
MAKYSFCRGIFLDANFCEVTCKRRERCAYYDVEFYRKHGHHLDEFEELFPHEPCGWFVEKVADVPQHTEHGNDLFAMLKGES